MNDPVVLVVDDEKSLRDFVRRNLEARRYKVITASNGLEAMAAFQNETIDLVILDLMMPHLDGLETTRRIRQTSQTPIIILTALGEESDKVQAFDLGADDYLTKPFNPRELIARVKAILRRSDGKQQADGKPIHRGDLTIDPVSREVSVASRTLDLRTQEFDLLLTLAEQPGRVFSREQLLQLAWGFDFYGQTRTVDVHIAHLRKKIEGSTVKIETVTGVGYKLVV